MSERITSIEDLAGIAGAELGAKQGKSKIEKDAKTVTTIKSLTSEQLWYYSEPEQLVKQQKIEAAIQEIASMLKCGPREIKDRVNKLLADIEQFEEQIAVVKAKIEA